MKQTNNPNRQKTWGSHVGICACVFIAVLLATGQLQAQAVYRVVGADGRITYSDKPPAASDNAATTGASGKSANAGMAALPYELLQVVRKFPVTLYTSNNCVPCDSGRALLSNRGIAFTEKSINTVEDSAALQRLSGEVSLPFLTIGGQQIKGYSDLEWTQFLNAAGYPKTSALPAGYRNPPVTPLVTVQKLVPAEKAEGTPAQRAPANPTRPPVAAPSNPAGITF